MSALLRAEIDAVLADWAWYLDHGEFAKVAGLFTEDARFTAGQTELRGRAQILQRYTARTGTRTTRHLYSGLRLSETGGHTVRAHSTWACYAANRAAPADEAAIYLVADFRDLLARQPDGRWLIHERRIVPVFRDPSRAPVTL